MTDDSTFRPKRNDPPELDLIEMARRVIEHEIACERILETDAGLEFGCFYRDVIDIRPIHELQIASPRDFNVMHQQFQSGRRLPKGALGTASACV